ncbi:MAG: 4Fe-4S binding protein [Planctomycetes bacterium]|nr:4Fe-4S binding protein [Planctomycetota bacterium]
MRSNADKNDGPPRSRIVRVLVTLVITAVAVLVSADGGPIGTHQTPKIEKYADRAWLPLGDTANDLTPFLVMSGLLVAAAILMWVVPKRQWTRRVVQTISAVAFIIGIHPCGCMTRDLILGVADLSVNDLSAFKYMVVFTTVGAFAAVVGRSFCGWVCPLGYAQELVAKVSRRFHAYVDRGWYVEALCGALLFFDGGLLLYRLLVAPADMHFAKVYGGVFIAVAGVIVLGAFLRSSLIVKYLFGVQILLAILYAFYLTKPGTYSVIEYTMVFFVLGLVLIVLTVLGDEKKDGFFKKFRYAIWLAIVAIYVYQLFHVGPMCLLFQGSAEWPVLLSFGGVFLLSILLTMPWCRYMCPEGTLMGLLASRAYWQINRNDRCTGCGSCTRACPLHCIECGIRDRKSCIYCMKCVRECPENALALVSELPGKTQDVPYPFPEERIAEEAT